MNKMNKHQQLMTIMMEECGELIQRCSKMMRKYETIEEVDEKQRVKLLEELGDVQCMIGLMVDHKYVSGLEIGTRVNTKREKLQKWSDLIHGNEHT